MKTRFQIRRMMVAWSATSVASLLLLGAFPVRAAEPQEQRVREEIEQLEQKAAELKAQGEGDRAQAVMREARQLRARAEKIERGEDGVRSEDARREELRRELKRAKAELKESREANKEDEAVERERHVRELGRELARLEEPRRAMQEPPAGPAEPQRRLRHLQMAIENLHAAGMHEPADQLARQAEIMRQQLQQAGDGFSPSGGPEGEIQRLRDEIQELRQAMRELRERVEQLSRDRR